jgi:hypothetical protein
MTTITRCATFATSSAHLRAWKKERGTRKVMANLWCLKDSTINLSKLWSLELLKCHTSSAYHPNYSYCVAVPELLKCHTSSAYHPNYSYCVAVPGNDGRSRNVNQKAVAVSYLIKNKCPWMNLHQTNLTSFH